MKIFITGATGFIGSKLALRLAEEGHQVHALYRSAEKALLIHHENIKLFNGDITNSESMERAIHGCEFAFHTAAFAKIWSKNPSLIYRLNVDATMGVLDLALKHGIKKIVVTSTAGVFGPSVNDITCETSFYEKGFFTHYEKSKSKMEDRIAERVKRGENIVIVNPTRVYGQGQLNESNSVTIMIKNYTLGKWRIIPGSGQRLGNYVFVDDVVEGHILALIKGTAGEKYILGGSNVSYQDFFKILREKSGKRFLMVKLPVFFMMIMAYVMLLLAKVSGISPMITPGLVKKISHNWNVSSEKSVKQLGYKYVNIEKGIEKTLLWLKNKS